MKTNALICTCKHCKARYVPEPLESHYECRECKAKVSRHRTCTHGVELTTVCAQCYATHGSRGIRTLARAGTVTRKELKKANQLKVDHEYLRCLQMLG